MSGKQNEEVLKKKQSAFHDCMLRRTLKIGFRMVVSKVLLIVFLSNIGSRKFWIVY